MAKNPIPKKIAGIRIPKRVRKSRTLKSLLKNRVGREIVATALTAGATAAAAALVRERDELAHAAGAGAKKGVRAGSLVSAAIHEATRAVVGVVSEAAHSVPGHDRRRDDRRGGDDARH